jgi:16S rRNA G527 N7-methylase RsmG
MGLVSGNLVDVGSGAGFPAIPVKVFLPDLQLTLVERSQKKVGFLRKAVAVLGLGNVTIHAGELATLRLSTPPDGITARAVEAPERMIGQIYKAMGAETIFFSQFEHCGHEELVAEAVQDEWSKVGFRRGKLEIMTRKR